MSNNSTHSLIGLSMKKAGQPYKSKITSVYEVSIAKYFLFLCRVLESQATQSITFWAGGKLEHRGALQSRSITMKNKTFKDLDSTCQ